MSFLNQLKSQASALQSQQAMVQQGQTVKAEQTEAACRVVAHYLRDLAKNLNVIEPAGPSFSLDGKTPWPAMKLCSFQADVRKKVMHDQEVFDYMSIGWVISPKMGFAVGGSVDASLVSEIDRIQHLLTSSSVEHKRAEKRHPERRSLLSVSFTYTTLARGYIMVKADHLAGQLVFRVANCNDFGVVTTTLAAERINTSLMDELAKLIVAQPSNFV